MKNCLDCLEIRICPVKMIIYCAENLWKKDNGDPKIIKLDRTEVNLKEETCYNHQITISQFLRIEFRQAFLQADKCSIYPGS